MCELPGPRGGSDPRRRAPRGDSPLDTGRTRTQKAPGCPAGLPTRTGPSLQPPTRTLGAALMWFDPWSLSRCGHRKSVASTRQRRSCLSCGPPSVPGAMSHDGLLAYPALPGLLLPVDERTTAPRDQRSCRTLVPASSRSNSVLYRSPGPPWPVLSPKQAGVAQGRTWSSQRLDVAEAAFVSRRLTEAPGEEDGGLLGSVCGAARRGRLERRPCPQVKGRCSRCERSAAGCCT